MNQEPSPWAPGAGVRLREEYIHGLKCYRERNWSGALPFFRCADERADPHDVHRNRYTSYHGLVRVYMGDVAGINLCRQATVDEQNDADVFHNLALAELRQSNRRGAFLAVSEGLSIMPAHRGLKRIREKMGVRRRPVLAFLHRDNFLNRYLGKLTYRTAGKRRT